MEADPVCRTPAELEAHDRSYVVLVGRYQPSLTARRHHGPLHDFGLAEIVVVDTPVRLGGGPRDEEERRQFFGQTVAVRGWLCLEPPPGMAGEAPGTSPMPTLLRCGEVRAWMEGPA